MNKNFPLAEVTLSPLLQDTKTEEVVYGSCQNNMPFTPICIDQQKNENVLQILCRTKKPDKWVRQKVFVYREWKHFNFQVNVIFNRNYTRIEANQTFVKVVLIFIILRLSKFQNLLNFSIWIQFFFLNEWNIFWFQDIMTKIIIIFWIFILFQFQFENYFYLFLLNSK